MASDLYHSCGVVTMASTVFLCLISKSISHQKSTTGTSSEVCTRLITLSATHVRLYNPLLYNTHHTYIIMYIVSFTRIISYIIIIYHIIYIIIYLITYHIIYHNYHISYHIIYMHHTIYMHHIIYHISSDIHVYQAMHV